MKKLLLFCIVFGISIASHSQTGITCNTPAELASADTTITNDTLAGSEKWYRFLASSIREVITVKKLMSSNGHIHKVELFSGTCSSLSIAGGAVADSTNDSVLVIAVSNLIEGNYYYIKTERSDVMCSKCTASPATYSLSLLSGSAGGFHSLFLCANGDIYSTGRNDWGQLGNGTFVSSSTPVAVAGGYSAIAVSAGVDHSLALLNTGTVIAWGSNTAGQLGNGSTITSNIPVSVIGLTNVIAISAGNVFSLALKSDGTVWAWGNNVTGQLGDNTTISHSIAAPVVGLTNVKGISCAEFHSMAVKNDGTVWTWGYNFSGELGDGTFTTRLLPVQEANGFTNIDAVSAGSNFSLILNNSGAVFATGLNNSTFGDGTFINSQVFVPSSSVPAGMTKIDAGANHSLALRNDGTAWGWGVNTDGALGNGTNISNLIVTQVVSLTCVSDISAGWNFSIITTASGAAYGFGDNSFGQLGDATTTDRNTPTAVVLSCPVAVPPLTITGINSVCFGASTNLTVTTGIGPYSWAGPGLSSGSGTTVTATPTTTTTYTVTDACMNTGTFTVTINPGCCIGAFTVNLGNDVTGSTFAGGVTTFTGTTIAVTSNLTIGSFTSFSNCTFFFEPNTKIIIPSGQTLVIDKSSLYSCGLQMWDGIEIEPGGNLIIQNKSLIEDAKIAILSKNSTGIGNFTIDRTTFNRNYIGVKVENHTTGTLHPGIIRRSTFHSTASTTSTTNTASLDAPYTTQTAEKGVYLFNVNSIQIGDPLTPLYQNEFVYLRIGIHAEGSTYRAYNNSFHNNFLPFACFGCPVRGWAIWNNRTKAVIGGSLTNQPNKFKDIGNGIIHENGTSLDAFYNTFENMIYSFPYSGGTAIYTRNFSQTGVIRIISNDIKDVKTGLFHQNNSTTSYTAQNNLFKNFNARGIYCVQNSYGSINIMSNDFNQSPSSVYTGNIGIEISNAVVGLGASPTVNVSSNTIYRMNKGILLNTINKPQVKNNNIAFQSTIVPSGPAFYYGIRSLICDEEYIYQNAVTKSGANPTLTFENGVYGITVETNQTFVSVLENNTAKVGTGLRFRSYYNANSAIRCNIMNRNFSGLGLDNVRVGNQGAPATITPPFPRDAADNSWTSPSYVAGSVSVRGTGLLPTPPAFDIFYTRSAAYPWCPSAVSIQPAFSITTATNSGITYLTPAAPTTCSNLCGTPPYPPCMHAPLAKIARDEAPFDAVTGTKRYLMHEGLLRGVLADSIPPDTTTIDGLDIQTFINDALVNTNLGKFVNVGILYSAADTAGAMALNASVATTRCEEEYHKIVNSIFFNTWGIGNFYISPPDSLTLYNIAILDPLDCGTAIYDARVMLGIDINDFTEPGHMMQSFEEQGTAVEDKIGVLYPNPAHGSCTYEAALTETQSGFIMIYDLNGKLLQSYKLNSGDNKVEMDLSVYSNGVYMYQIVINGESIEHKKLVISK